VVRLSIGLDQPIASSEDVQRVDSDERVARGLLRSLDALEKEALACELLSEAGEDGKRIELLALVKGDTSGQLNMRELI